MWLVESGRVAALSPRGRGLDGAGQGLSGWAMEGWTLLSAVAMITDRLRLGILATGNTYRNPALVAKIATTLDHVSGGRVELGLGAAWYEQEHTAYGWDFPSLRERSDRLEEATQLIRLLLTKDPEEYVNYSGKYYQLNDAPMSPRTAQDRPIPILIGGNGAHPQDLCALWLYQ